MKDHEENITRWIKFLVYFDSIEVGKKFTRQHMIRKLYGVDAAANKISRKMLTIDNYRALLTKCEIVTRIKPGVYRKEMNVPKETQYSLIREISSDESWRRWFIGMDELLKRK